jgi:hypothetical protein
MHMPDPADTEAGDLKTVPNLRFRLNWPVTTVFREEISKRESQRDGYLSRNGKALGAYQLTPDALRDIGWLDADGHWTEKSGVTDYTAFWTSPLRQEIALKEFLLRNRQLLAANNFEVPIGQSVQGIKGDFTITENGLAAAMHREGEPRVRRYLKFLAKQGWTSDETKFPGESADIFRHIETRLREFADIPYLRPHGH